jgi:GntR family transcriptional repressor for pyruvate dehydrogenase complex
MATLARVAPVPAIAYSATMKTKTSDVTLSETGQWPRARRPAAVPTDARKRVELVRDKLVALIRDGRLQEGHKLPTEPQLSAMFGVGRSSVREAVQSLIGLGMVEMRPGRGAYVKRLSLNDLVQLIDGAVRLEYGAALQLHEVRAMIEITAARLAAARRTDDDLARMREAIVDYRIADHLSNREGQIDADLAFHRAVVQATHNEVLVKVLESISGLLREHRRQYGYGTEHGPESRSFVIAEHEGILAAIAEGDPREAAGRTQRHMRIIWELIERLAMKEGNSAFAGQSYAPMYETSDTFPDAEMGI